MEPVVSLTDMPPPEAEAVISEGLAAYNEQHAGYRDRRRLAVLLSDPATGAVLGGLIGRTSLGLLYIDLFHLPAGLRGGGLGTRILREAEEEARRRGCRSGMLVTVTFQAPGFYARQGWREFGRIPCDPPGAARVFLRKEFGPARDAGEADPGRRDARPAYSVADARHCFAEELRFTARVASRVVVDAFASVPRERFVGPGPWRIRSPMGAGAYWTTEDADPRAVYHDVLIALDEVRGINNGQPSLWIRLFDQLGIAPGESVLHLGCGTGYYTAIAAELAGSAGTVTALEIDATLAGRARASLAAWPQVCVRNTDGSSARIDPSDVIFLSAGATHPLAAWLDALKPGGRLLLPLIGEDRGGGMLLVTRRAAEAYAARFLCPAGFIPFSGACDPEIGRRLTAALQRDGGAAVKSLRRAPAAPDETCWLAGADWFLSTDDTDGVSPL